jgi:hypothetical protein
MNDLESRLREELFALVSDLPPAIDVNASVRRGQRRLRRRRVAAACCVVAVVGAGAGSSPRSGAVIQLPRAYPKRRRTHAHWAMPVRGGWPHLRCRTGPSRARAR